MCLISMCDLTFVILIFLIYIKRIWESIFKNNSNPNSQEFTKSLYLWFSNQTLISNRSPTLNCFWNYHSWILRTNFKIKYIDGINGWKYYRYYCWQSRNLVQWIRSKSWNISELKVFDILSERLNELHGKLLVWPRGIGSKWVIKWEGDLWNSRKWDLISKCLHLLVINLLVSLTLVAEI